MPYSAKFITQVPLLKTQLFNVKWYERNIMNIVPAIL